MKVKPLLFELAKIATPVLLKFLLDSFGASILPARLWNLIEPHIDAIWYIVIALCLVLVLDSIFRRRSLDDSFGVVNMGSDVPRIGYIMQRRLMWPVHAEVDPVFLEHIALHDSNTRIGRGRPECAKCRSTLRLRDGRYVSTARCPIHGVISVRRKKWSDVRDDVESRLHGQLRSGETTLDSFKDTDPLQ